MTIEDDENAPDYEDLPLWPQDALQPHEVTEKGICDHCEQLTDDPDSNCCDDCWALIVQIDRRATT